MNHVYEIESSWIKFRDELVSYGPTLIYTLVSALVILFVGLWLIKMLSKLMHRIFAKRGLDISVRNFLENIFAWTLRILLFIVVIGKLGVQTSSFVAIIGAAGLAVGLALQGSLANFAGGILILLFKPFKVGDYIASSEGVEGTVLSVDIFHTKLNTAENQMIIIPNGGLSNSKITNYSTFNTRRTWFDVRIPYSADIDKAKLALLKVAKSNPFALESPKPQIVVSKLGENFVNLSVRVSANSSDFWTMHEQLLIECKTALQRTDIGIPSTHHEIHIVSKDDVR